MRALTIAMALMFIFGMEIVSTDQQGVSRAAEVISAGGVVIHPTETCYGFTCDVFNEDALERVYRLKGRDFQKPVSIFVDGLEMAEKFGFFNDKARELVARFWPGALSIVVPRKDLLPEFLNPGEAYVSMRFSDFDFVNEVVTLFRGPIITTSANLSGNSPLYSLDVSQFGDDVVLIDLGVDGGEIVENPPSTVVKVVGEEILVLRQGAVKV